MRAGDLRRRIQVQSRQTTIDTYGQQSTTWASVLSDLPAAIDPMSGRELLAAQSINAEITHKITVRYHLLLADPIKVAGYRVVYTNGGVTRYFNVASCINVEERNREINLMATEGLNQG
jgi:SPP1 family predicted phage head-tail adaptor